MKLTIKNKILLLLLAPLFLTFIILILVASNYIENYLISEYENSHNELMIANSLYFNQVISNSADEAEKIALLVKETNAIDTTKLTSLIKKIISNEDIILGIAIAFEPNVYPNRYLYAPFYYRKNKDIAFVDIANKEFGYDYTSNKYDWYRIPSLTKKPHWSEPFYSGVLKEQKVIAYSVPIMNQNQLLGVIVIDFDMYTINDFLRKSIKTSTSRFVVISPKGKYVSHPEKDRILDKNLLNDNKSLLSLVNRTFLLDEISKRHNGFIRVKDNSNGKPLLAFFSTNPLTNWKIIAYTYEEKLTSPITKILNRVLIIIIIFFSLTVILVTIVTNKFLSPIGIIKSFSRKIADGQYPVSMKSVSNDEFEELIDDLNIMNEQLKKRENELNSLNRNLENRVEQRTDELNKALIYSKKLSTAVEQSPVPISIIEKSGIVEYINPEYSNITGYLKDDVIGLIHPLLSNNTIDLQTFERYKKILKSGKKIKGEFETYRKNGEKFWMKFAAIGVSDENKGANNFVFVEEDVTKAKYTELKIKENSELLLKQNVEIAQRNKYITDSINYAKRIQDALLFSDKVLESILSHHFLIFLPKDVVSGDFYWMINYKGNKIFAVVDCTGHGVSGALMSMIGYTLLNEIVNLQNIIEPSEILNNLNKRVIEELQRKGNLETNDGMDIVVGVYEPKINRISLSSAYRNIIYFVGNELFEIKGDRKSIGDAKKKLSFTTHEILITKTTELYLFSDGFVDQNNIEEKKYGLKRLKNVLEEIHSKEMEDQKEILVNDFKKHIGQEVQRDDITLLGLRFFNPPLIPIKLFKGVFTYNSILSACDEIEQQFSYIEDIKLQKRIFFIANELMQNIAFYSSEREIVEDKETGKGIFKIEKLGDDFLLTSENFVNEITFIKVFDNISKLNSLNHEELKELRKQKLKLSPDSDSKGAGLGLIEIARKTDEPIQITKKNKDEKIYMKIEIKIKTGEFNGAY